MSLVSVGHSTSDLIMPLMLRTVYCAMGRALVLYYKSLGIALTLPRRGNILGRPCIGVMTWNALAFSYIKTIR
jgi:hypothetical protein